MRLPTKAGETDDPAARNYLQRPARISTNQASHYEVAKLPLMMETTRPLVLPIRTPAFGQKRTFVQILFGRHQYDAISGNA